MREKTDVAPKTAIRWVCRRDLDTILQIDKQVLSAIGYWQEADWLSILRKQNCIGMVIEYDQQIIGFMAYRLDSGFLQIIRYAILPEFQRKGCGNRLIDRMKTKLGANNKRAALSIIVPDRLLACHLHLRSCGFTCQEILRNGWSDGSDAYLFGWDCRGIDLWPRAREVSKTSLASDDLW